MSKEKYKKVQINKREKKKVESILTGGTRTKKQLMAPAGVAYPDENQLLVENNYVRSYVMNYPSTVGVGSLDTLFSYRGDVDTVFHIEPTDTAAAIDELTEQIVKYETQRIQENDGGSIKNSTSIPAKLQVLYEQRAKLEQNYESMFRVSSLFDMFGSNKEKLNKESQKFVAKLNGSRIHVMPLTLREDDGFRTVSPYGVNKVPDYYRNMNTGALSALFPFYNPEINHVNGVYLGINKQTGTATIIDFFNRAVLGNANIFITGQSGFGKTVLTSLIITRSLPEQVRTVILDIENEYGSCTEISGGVNIRIAPGSEEMINPFDIDEEYRLDKNGNPTNEKYVDIKGKVAELLNLFSIMVSEVSESDMKAEISEILLQLYADFGFSESPESLYEEVRLFNEETSEYYYGKKYKKMPCMSDFYERFSVRAKQTGSELMEKAENAFRLYVKGGLYDLFDCYTSIDLDVFKTAPVIRFDLSQLEDDVFRPLGMHVTTTWAWNRFIKKDKKSKKRIVSDETWVLLSSNTKGSEYTSRFLEQCARRIRKYNGSLLCASQNFREFVSRSEGRAILSNTAVKMFLRQSAEDIAEVEEMFILSSGEKSFLLGSARGEVLIKMGEESVVSEVIRFPFEEKLFNDLEKKGADV